MGRCAQAAEALIATACGLPFFTLALVSTELNPPLDSTRQQMSIPNNCVACHGTSTKVTLGDNPLPNTPVVSKDVPLLSFDMYAFKYSSDPALSLTAHQRGG